MWDGSRVKFGVVVFTGEGEDTSLGCLSGIKRMRGILGYCNDRAWDEIQLRA
jgi:1,4-dihydroxy-2-naphthoyl-CoA synthase